jgi:microcystin-dependent protein
MMKRMLTTVAATALLAAGLAGPALAGADPFLGQIMLTGDLYCPKGWADANGQLIAISQNQALFSLFGTTYGGNGQTNFALPNLQTRVILSQGQGPGQPNYVQGQVGGAALETLTIAQMPAHNHPMTATSDPPDSVSPSGGAFGTFSGGLLIYNTGGTANLAFNPSVIGNAGGNQPFDNRQPYIVLRYCVALQGIYPSRN